MFFLAVLIRFAQKSASEHCCYAAHHSTSLYCTSVVSFHKLTISESKIVIDTNIKTETSEVLDTISMLECAQY